MKNRTWLLGTSVVLVFFLVLIFQSKLVRASSYNSWCTAQHDFSSLSDEGETSASISGDGFSADSNVDHWKLGSVIELYLDPLSPSFSGYLAADSSITQKFVVTGTGQAHIYFTYDGELAVENTGSGTIDGMYALGFRIEGYDDISTNVLSVGEFLDNPGSKSYNQQKNFYYNFTEADIGKIFEVNLELTAYLSSEGEITYSDADDPVLGEGEANFRSDFYNTAKITFFDGPIALAPENNVPTPGAFWLLGSGLCGLAIIMRRKRLV